MTASSHQARLKLWPALFIGRQHGGHSRRRLPTLLAKAGASKARNFIDKFTAHLEHLAELPIRVGRRRPDLSTDYRSVPFGDYIVILRYADEEGPRSHLYVVHIVHSARDVDAYNAVEDEDR